MKRILTALVLAALVALAPIAYAQAPTNVAQGTPVSAIVLTPISATAAVNNATTLTIPAPAGGLFNYVCYLAFQVSNDGTGTAVTNAVSTSTNFNSFAVKVSTPATASVDSGLIVALNSPFPGCAKSAAAGTATTFVSPSGQTHAAWTWYAAYFQAP